MRPRRLRRCRQWKAQHDPVRLRQHLSAHPVRTRHLHRRPARRARQHGPASCASSTRPSARTARRSSASWSAAPGDDRARRARLLDDCDTVIVQHEYGVYGGPTATKCSPSLPRCARRPSSSCTPFSAHPTPHQRRVLEAVDRAGRRGRHHDRRLPTSDSRRLRRRHAQGQRHPARRPAVRRGADAALPYRSSDGLDLGPDRSGQGHRVGHRGDGAISRTSTRRRATSSPARPTRRCCCARARPTAIGSGPHRRARPRLERQSRRPLPRQWSSWASWSTPPTSCCCRTTRPTR